MEQLVFHPTRDKNILDLILTNNSESITNVCINDNIANSNHNVICFHLLMEFDFHKYKNESRNFKKAYYNEIKKVLSALKWDNLLDNKSVEQQWNIFISIFKDTVNKFSPLNSNNVKVKNMIG